MRRSSLLFLFLLLACVDPEAILLNQRVNVVVVDGTLTDRAEPQLIFLNRSKSDPITGRFGTLPLSGVRVEVWVDSTERIAFAETTPGRYQGPEDFRGRVGHAYQLRLTLPDGTRYESGAEVMPAVPPMDRLTERFNATSFASPDLYKTRAANELSVDWRDPADQKNYYRWDWKLWERQEWCRTCVQGNYYAQSPFDQKQVFEDCYAVPNPPIYWFNDYPCRTACWEILTNQALTLLDDQFVNGRPVPGFQIARIPYFQSRGCLVEIRQSSLTAAAYRFYKLVQEQTQNTGGLVDTPPTAVVGNVVNPANRRERVVGYFTASAVSAVRYWLDRAANTGRPPGLFNALNALLPSPPGLARDPNTDEPKPVPDYRSASTALCVPSDSRTNQKPEGWRE
jgi:hypothetical protein